MSQDAFHNFTAQFNIGSNPSLNNLRVGYAAGGTTRSFTLLQNVNAAMTFVNESIGYDGIGVFTQSGGTNGISGSLRLGELAGGDGTYGMNSSLARMTAPALYLGGSDAAAGGKGTLEISAGTAVISGSVKAWNAASTITINGGTLWAGGVILPNWSQLTFTSGKLIITGGTTSNPGQLTIGGSSGTATATFSGGTHSAGLVVVGSQSGGAGEFVHGSSRFLPTGIQLGAATGSAGLYTMSSGVLETGGITVGLSGVGEFQQFGGNSTATGVTLGSQAGSSGTYTMASGATLTVSNSVAVGNLGTGLFNQMGGTLSANNLMISSNSGAGTYNQSGGSIVTTTTIIGTGDAAGLFNQSGGTHTASNLYIGAPYYSVPPITGTGSYNLSGGTLDAALAVNSGTFTMTGGRVAGYFVNKADFRVNYTSTTLEISGTLVNQGLIAIADRLTVTGLLSNLADGAVTGGNGIPNVDGRLIITSSGRFEGTGTLPLFWVDNAGTIMARYGNLVINPSQLTNTGTLANAAGASLFIQTAPYTLVPVTPFVNAGNVLVNSGGTVSFDTSQVIPAGKTATLAGGTLAAPTLTNSGTVTGSGQISGNFINSGTATLNGPTQLFGTLTNNAVGQITVRNSQFLVTGAAVNNGTIRAVSGGSVVFDAGLTGNAPLPGPVPGEPLPSSPLAAGAVLLESGASITANYIRQETLSLTGTAGNPSSYSQVNIRRKIDGGDTSLVNTLTIQTDGGGNPLGRLDLNDNALIVDYSGATPATTLRALLVAGYTGGTWAGNGITSGVAASNPSQHSLGYGEASTLLGLTGTNTTTWQGQTVDSTSLLIRHTLNGDADLSGAVNFFDLTALAASYGQPGTWQSGDFNYDGQVNFFDLTALAANYGGALASDIPFALASVPEPGTLGFAAAAAFAALRRRRDWRMR